MIYSLFKYLDSIVDIPGSRMFQYISFRSGLAAMTALLILIFFGGKIIRYLQRHQVGEEIRKLGLEGQDKKAGTPTMGGLLIILAIVIPLLLFCRLDNIYVILLLISTIWCGILGFLDDYIKVFRHNKDGLKGKFKIIGQVGLGLIVGIVMCFSEQVTIREKVSNPSVPATAWTQYMDADGNPIQVDTPQSNTRATKTTIPFFKSNEFDYAWLSGGNKILSYIIYIILAVFIVTAVSNGANLTDGLDGLLTGVSVPIAAVLGILAYLSGNIVYSDYLNIMYIPDSGELLVVASIMIGALIGFLWFNCFPAQIFMGDTGSLTIGGIIAVFALCIRKELLLPIMCGIFLIEAVSVMIQTSYYKYSRKKYGEPRRIFKMAPLHHHYQKNGLPETKIVVRFIIISLLLAVVSLITLKIR